jgi:hypothetical protein
MGFQKINYSHLEIPLCEQNIENPPTLSEQLTHLKKLNQKHQNTIMTIVVSNK